MSRSLSVRFNGITFRRYPDSPQWADREYYTPGIADRQRGVGRLHEEVWKAAHGPIPDGYEIHHADFDPDNNDVRNLVCLTVDEHQAAHRQRKYERSQSPEHRAHLERIRPLAADWHRTEEGRAWHRQNAARQGFGAGERRTEVCEQCGEQYETTKPAAGDRFCSNRCKSAWRRASGLDDEQRTCAHCGGVFTVNKYSRARCCSRTCAQRRRAAEARARVEPDGG